MIVRALDTDGDWLYGKGKNDYLSGVEAVAQDIQTRLNSFLGNCFFDLAAGIDWFNLLGSKNILALKLAVRTVIQNTPNVIGLVELSAVLDHNRHITLTYSVQTAFGGLVKNQLDFLLDEFGDFLTTDDGVLIHA